MVKYTYLIGNLLNMSEKNIQNFYDLVDAQEVLRDNLSTVTKDNKELYQELYLLAEHRVGEFLCNDQTRSIVIEEYQNKQKALIELDDLGSAIKAGLIDEEIIAKKRQEIVSSEEYIKLQKYVGRAAVNGAISSQPVHSTEAAVKVPVFDVQPVTFMPEVSENLKTNVDIILNGERLYIGSVSKENRIQIVRNPNIELKDEAKFKLLESILTIETEEIRPKELWDKAFPGEPLNTDDLVNFRRFISKLVYNGKQIIVHNGLRGAGSFYAVDESLNVRLVVHDGQASNATVIEDNRTIQTSTTSLAEGQDTLKVFENYDISTIYFPLDLVESEAIAALIQNNQDLLNSKIGIGVIDKTLTTDLIILVDAESIQRSIEKIDPSATILDLRKNALNKIKTFMGSKDGINAALDNLAKEDPRYKLLEYISSINEDKIAEFINILDSKKVISGTLDPHTGWLSPVIKVELPDGERYYVAGDPNGKYTTFNPTYDQIDTDYDNLKISAPIITQEVFDVRTDHQEPDEIKEPITAEEEVITVNDPIIPDLDNQKLRIEFEQKLRSKLKTILDVVDKCSLEGKTYYVIGAAFRDNGINLSATPKDIRSASERGLISRDSGSKILSIKEIIMLTLDQDSEFNSALGIRKSKKPDKKLIDKLVSEELELYLNKSS